MDAAADELLRELAPQVLGAVIRRYRDFAASEDAVQEALIAASAQWPRDGLPDNPRGWLIQVASRRMTDYLRSERARQRRETAVAVEADAQTSPPPDAVQQPGWRSSRPSTTMIASPAIIASTPCARTCSRWLAITNGPRLITVAPPIARRAFPNGTIC